MQRNTGWIKFSYKGLPFLIWTEPKMDEIEHFKEVFISFSNQNSNNGLRLVPPEPQNKRVKSQNKQNILIILAKYNLKRDNKNNITTIIDHSELGKYYTNYLEGMELFKGKIYMH
ncbi:MAG: hypothetical protein QXX17_06285 [Conexivisphaerales archaeon]